MALRWGLGSIALAVSVLGCVERSEDWQDELETSGSESESSAGERDVPSCVDEPTVEELPNALAWHEVNDDGTPALHVHVQSEPATCGQRDSAVTDGTQIRLRIPIALDPPTRLDLGELDAYALMSPGGPGNDGDIYTIRWLTGTVDVETIDDERITGALHDAYGSFDGCFDAPVCPD